MAASDSLRDSVRGAPALPGVYSFLDAAGAILYIGKARDLRARLQGHLSNEGDQRHRILLERAVSVEWTITRNEVEALILEAELIRIRKPPLNVMLRSSSRYPHLELTLDEEYPRLIVTREAEALPGRPRFGPYPDSRNLRKLVEILLDAYPLRRCGAAAPPSHPRACLMGQLGRCPAPCTGGVDPGACRREAREMLKVLRGDWDGARKGIEERMRRAASGMDFEEAARLRDLLARLDSFGWPAPTSVNDRVSRDAVAVLDNWGIIMRMRGGRMTGLVRMPFDGKWKLAATPERLSVLMRTYYGETQDIPAEILAPVEPEASEAIGEWLASRRGGPVRIRVPMRGGLREMVELADRDLVHFLNRLAWKRPAGSRGRTEAALEGLADILGLSAPPAWIVCLDASTIQGSYPVAAIVSFREGRPDKSGYRRFTMPPEIGRNDPAMIRSAVARYLPSLEEGLPDLLLVDGGITQLRAAGSAAAEVGADLRVLSIAKKEELLLDGLDEREIRLPLDSIPLSLLRTIRDEAHRFVLHYHQQKRSAGGLRSVLDGIPGIGAATTARLLVHFGSAVRVAAASLEEIMEVPGVGERRARMVAAFLAREKSGTGYE